MKEINNYINGRASNKSKNFLPVEDPSTGDQISKVVLSNVDDFKEVEKSSEKAFKDWSKYTPLKRSRILSKYKEILEKNIDTLAKLVSLEHGKTLDDAK